jgi:hypothetical protein
LQGQYPLTHNTPLFAFLKHPSSRTTPFRILNPPYDKPSNLSSYYGMPILEPPDVEQRCEEGVWYTSDSEEEDDDEDGNEIIKVIKQLNHPQPARTMPPSQSLILYLWGRGLSIPCIASALGNLDPVFVHELASGNRWVKALNRISGGEELQRVKDGDGDLVKVGAHWELDDGKVREVIEGFMGEREGWEEGVGNEKGVELRRRFRGRGVERLGVASLENYLSYRLRGVWAHRDICM